MSTETQQWRELAKSCFTTMGHHAIAGDVGRALLAAIDAALKDKS